MNPYPFDMKASVWNRIRRQLKVEFERKQITRCEQCNAAYPLGFAHRYKRRFITTESELRIAALLCNQCHERYEFAGHEKMYEGINKIIEGRNEYTA